ncbi:MAG: hypothetical protein EOP48_11600 [Sphingobacteriales bacterium]|nr:MAG: hypothetical protein EOP48_11600 [Sphingobacteriales bacterium]
MAPKPFIKLKRAIQNYPIWQEPKSLKLLIALLFETNEQGEAIVSLNQLLCWVHTYDTDKVFAMLQRLRTLEEIRYEIKPAITESGRLDNRIFITVIQYKTYVEHE